MAVLVFAGCSRAPVVTITNRSSVTLSHVVISGSGFSEDIGSLAPGAQHVLTVHPRGDSGVRVAFEASGRKFDSGEQDYFEASGGYRITVTVGPDFKLTSTSNIPRY